MTVHKISLNTSLKTCYLYQTHNKIIIESYTAIISFLKNIKRYYLIQTPNTLHNKTLHVSILNNIIMTLIKRNKKHKNSCKKI